MATFQYVAPTDKQKELMQNFRDKYEQLYTEVKGLYEQLYTEVKGLETSRGLSLALTKLEESAMWLNKAITKND